MILISQQALVNIVDGVMTIAALAYSKIKHRYTERKINSEINIFEKLVM